MFAFKTGVKSFSKHIIPIGRVVAILFVLATSGFTTVLYLCCHEDHMVRYENTCRHGESCGPEEGNCSIPTLHLDVALTGGCHTIISGGGLNTNPALLEEESKMQPKRIEVPSTLLSSDKSLSLLNITSKSYSPFFSIVSPQSQEKYILTHSILI